MVAKRDLTNPPNVQYPYVKKSFKTQHGRIAIDPAILAAVGNCFIAKKKKRKKTKNADVWFWGDARGDQKQDAFIFGLIDDNLLGNQDRG